MRKAHRRLLLDLLSLPTSPFHEQAVMAYIRAWAAKRPGIRLTTDAYGNLRLDLRCGGRGSIPDFFLSAHMDHPGFAAVGMLDEHRLEARWHGGVQPDFFGEARVRFHTDRRWVRGRIESYEVTDVMGRQRVSTAVVTVSRPVAAEAVGMWDLPNPTIRGTRLFARGCDDIAGVAATLAAFDILHDLGKPVHMGLLLTRAEEVGFAGAIAACRSGLLPKKTRVLSVECSPTQPGVEMGAGPVVRVGDRISVFDNGMVAWCRQVAEALARTTPDFAFQRKLLDGGACESSAYLEYGHETTGLSLPLGNYHNMDHRAGRIASEFVDLKDFERLVCWFVALATAETNSKRGSPKLRQTFDREHRIWGPMLRQSSIM
ncbi:MAG: M20/M25/M40 family metallo-hydrolase [Phycisphaerae bacterium]